MIKIVLYAILCLLFGMGIADNEAVPDYYLSECVACHEQMVSGSAKVLYTRKDRLAKNYEELTRRVHYCKDQLELDWSETQTHTVVEYLAEQYYLFPLLRGGIPKNNPLSQYPQVFLGADYTLMQ